MNSDQLKNLRDKTQEQINNNNYAGDVSKEDLEDQVEYLDRRIQYIDRITPDEEVNYINPNNNK